VELAGKALVQIVLSTVYAVNGFMEDLVVYLVNCRMWLVGNVRGVLMGSCFRAVAAIKEIMIRSLISWNAYTSSFLGELIGAVKGAEEA